MTIDKEYLAFRKSYEEVPKHLDTLVLQESKLSLSVDRQYIFTKFFLVHVLAGIGTLLVCPQFGWNPFSANPHVPHYFMQYGVWACGLFCGSVFMGAGTLATFKVVNKDDFKLYNQAFLKNSLIISSLMFAVLMIIGKTTGGEDTYFTFVFSFFWLLGAFLFEGISQKLYQLILSHGHKLNKEN